MADYVDRLKADEWLVLFDGARMRAYQNVGTADRPILALRSERHEEAAPAHDLGSDRPGRVHAPVGRAVSAVETVDRHEAAERAFVAHVAEDLESFRRHGDFATVVVAAPPEAIAAFRASRPADFRRVLRGEIVADLTEVPVEALQRRFTPTGARR